MTDFAIADAIRIYHAAAWPVLMDSAVWRDEQQRADAPPLRRPPPGLGTKYMRFVNLLAVADINVLLVLLRADDDPRSPEWPPNERDPKMQTLLRVALRAMQAGETAMLAAIGPGRITGWREFKNMVAEQMDQYARSLVRPGLTLDQVLQLLELPRSSAFRANKRRLHRKKSHFVRD